MAPWATAARNSTPSSRGLEREAHILQREPEALSSHRHNMLSLDQGEESPAGPPVRADLRAPGQIIA